MNTWRRMGSAFVEHHEKPRISSVCIGLEMEESGQKGGRKGKEDRISEKKVWKGGTGRRQTQG